MKMTMRNPNACDGDTAWPSATESWCLPFALLSSESCFLVLQTENAEANIIAI